MYAVNPVYIPRNHLVAEAISAAENHQDFEPFNRFVDILANPFEFNQGSARLHWHALNFASAAKTEFFSLIGQN